MEEAGGEWRMKEVKGRMEEAGGVVGMEEAGGVVGMKDARG